MKSFVILLATLACGALGQVQAIPQNFGGLLFSGLPLEEYLRTPEHWAAGHVFPGQWERESEDGDAAAAWVLEGVAAVFGERAGSVRRWPDTAGLLRRVTAHFEVADAAAGRDLRKRLESKIAAWASAALQNGAVSAHGLKVELIAEGAGWTVRITRGVAGP